jgi:PBP1b-binding outer membrane lipoprotein LpoB
MTKIEQILAILFTSLLLSACSKITEGLGGSKKIGSDEFLVEKKAPLELPPNFGELPEPGAGKETGGEMTKTNENDLSIEGLINQKSSVDKNKENKKSNNSIERLIIEKINEE